MSRKIKITFLDAPTVDFGDLKMDHIKKVGHYTAYEDCTPEELEQKARGAAVIITNKTFISGECYKKLPELKLICVSATGYNNIDIDGARENGIAVTNVAGYSTQTVAEHAIMFMLATSHRLEEHHRAVMRGDWQRAKHFAILDYHFCDLYGKTLGIIGYGTIGREVARLAKAFRMKVMVGKLPGRQYRKTEKRFSVEQIMKKSDFISLHTALNENTKNLINKNNLGLCKKNAVLINLARGAVVNESDLAEALEADKVFCYATDVLSHEPPDVNHVLLDPKYKDKVLITPHVAWASRESRQRLVDEIALNIKYFLKGKKRNRVD